MLKVSKVLTAGRMPEFINSRSIFKKDMTITTLEFMHSLTAEDFKAWCEANNAQQYLANFTIPVAGSKVICKVRHKK